MTAARKAKLDCVCVREGGGCGRQREREREGAREADECTRESVPREMPSL